MAAVLDLSNRSSRRLGMRRTDYHYAESLLESGPRIKEQDRNPTPDILAPPQDSSDEASIVHDEDLADDVHLVGYSSTRSNGTDSPEKTISGKSAAMLPQNPEGQSNLEPSSIPATKFGPSKGKRYISTSQRNQKEGDDEVGEDDEDMSGVWSQPKKPRTSYRSSSQRSSQVNIHLSSKAGQSKQPPKQIGTSAVPNGKQGLRLLKGTERAMARATKLGEQEKPEYKKPPWAESTSRSDKPSFQKPQVNQISTEERSRASFRIFKPLSPKQRTRRTAGSPTSTGHLSSSINSTGPRATRSSKADVDVSMYVNANMLRNGSIGSIDKSANQSSQAEEQFTLSSEVQDATEFAKQKLDLSANAYQPPSSSTNASSLPSASFDDASTDSPLSSPPPETPPISPTQRDTDFVKNVTLGFDSDRMGRCPVCKEKIDQDFLESNSTGERLTIRQQTEFCKAHKKHAAIVAWKQKCFPRIDWHHLDERLKNYHDATDDILQGREPSFYRNAFEDLVKTRKDRTLRKDLMNGNEIKELTPGYYGSRGAKIMVENIMSRFASKLRRLAASDKLIASGDISGYVQAVLVPELAVLLIMDDMNVDRERAREIMTESIDMGNLLNEEEDEQIRDPVNDTQ